MLGASLHRVRVAPCNVLGIGWPVEAVVSSAHLTVSFTLSMRLIVDICVAGYIAIQDGLSLLQNDVFHLLNRCEARRTGARYHHQEPHKWRKECLRK